MSPAPLADLPLARPAGLRRLGWIAKLLLLGLAACGQAPEEAPVVQAPAAQPAAVTQPEPVTQPAAGPAAAIPASMQSCHGCHRFAVESYLRHGMSGSLGPVPAQVPGRGGDLRPETGAVTNPHSGRRYEVTESGGAPFLTTTAADGGLRRQRIVGRIGAGVFDASWATAEVDPFTGEVTDRLFFAPLESVTGHGLELSPFELHAGSAGPDFALTSDCLTCHTTDRLEDLPGAAAFPRHALGADAFEHLSPLGCEACHGDTARHVEIMTTPGALSFESDADVGIARLGQLPAPTQRDVCARCHLQGDSRVELLADTADPAPRLDQPLAGQIPVVVPAGFVEDHRFVSQIERLALSPCFRESPAMTCTTCHEPHLGAAQQGVASFDAACASCHGGAESGSGSTCNRPPNLTVEQAAGTAARTHGMTGGCVDCHVRRSQPFDLPHVRSADHFIRRRIPPPADDVPHRQFADLEGPLEIYDDGRLEPLLATPGGERWRQGVLGFAFAATGRFDEAARHFAAFPPPGSPAARQPSAPAGLVDLETRPVFHHVRAAVLHATGDLPGALAAYDDALALDPQRAGARMARASLRLGRGDVQGMLEDTETVIRNVPGAEAPWNLRAAFALRLGRLNLAAEALEQVASRWPSNGGTWHDLGLVLAQLGRMDEAREAMQRAALLEPSKPGLDELAGQ